MNLLGSSLVLYSYLPHHPGKGKVFDHLLPKVSQAWTSPRLRKRYAVSFECDLREKLEREIYFTGFDRRDFRVLRQWIKRETTILDVGANIGYFSLVCAKWGGRVHAFEPFPSTIERLERNITLNPALGGRVSVHTVALSNFVGSTAMAVPDPSNSGCNHLERGSGEISVTTLDAFVSESKIEKIDIIKVDIEGSEIAFLEGARQTIADFRPRLMIEVNPGTLKRFGKTAADLIGLLGSLRYRLFIATRFGELRILDRLPRFGEEPNIFALPID